MFTAIKTYFTKELSSALIGLRADVEWLVARRVWLEARVVALEAKFAAAENVAVNQIEIKV